MISLRFFVYLFASSAYSQALRTVKPNLNRICLKTGGVLLASSTKSETSDMCTSRYSCVNCTAARICTPLPDKQGYREIQRFNCSGDSMYCDYNSGTCTTVQTRQCASQGYFICQRDGYFPDPYTCSKFHYCHNSISYTFTCQQNSYYYDCKSESCVYNKGCYGFSCSGKNGYKVTYTADPSIYAYCIGNAAAFVDRCQGQDELNTTSQKCEPICRKEGLIEDTEDCTGYYKCSIASQISITVTYSMTHHYCPDGQAYSPTEFQCVPIEQVPGCCDDFGYSNSTTVETPT